MLERFDNAGTVLEMQERFFKLVGKVFMQRKSGEGFKSPGEFIK